MKKYFLTLFLGAFLNIFAFAQKNASEKTEQYFRENRQNAVLMRAFFQSMPKGGDLHHHLSGSVYPETYLQWAVEKNLFVSSKTGQLFSEQPKDMPEVQPLRELLKKPELNFRSKLLQDWSNYFYSDHEGSSHFDFFKTFSLFGIAYDSYETEALREMRKRAASQHLQYLETMIGIAAVEKKYAEKYRDLKWDNAKKDSENFDFLYEELKKRGVKEYAKLFADSLFQINERSKLPKYGENELEMRFQTYSLRVISPEKTFARLVFAYEADLQSDLVVGVNFVAPEDDAASMANYDLHIRMFEFLQKKYPETKLALHAGELRLGLVKPEDLTFHIHDAVFRAKAKRIGHGTDIAHEKNLPELLKKMKEEGIAVELPLASNEFILGIKNDAHPISLYRKAGVPFVLATDDEGVLRTDMTEQFVLAALRYPDMTYSELKMLAFNGIRYSFLDDESKKRLIKKMEAAFEVFESKF
jgi:adenosine deaminase